MSIVARDLPSSNVRLDAAPDGNLWITANVFGPQDKYGLGPQYGGLARITPRGAINYFP